jgi:hypothetical protein
MDATPARVGARDEVARDVLIGTLPAVRFPVSWQLLCQPLEHNGYCFLNLHILRR